MSFKSLFKIQSLVAIVLFTGVTTRAQDDKPTAPTVARTSANPTPQSDAVTAYSLCKQNPSAYGGDCSDFKAMAMSASGASPAAACNQAQSAYATNFSNMLQQMQSSLNAQTKLTSELRAQSNAIAEQKLTARSADRNYSAAVAAINAALPVSKAQAQSATAKAIMSIREKVAELATKVSQANAALRAAASAINKVTRKQETTCRAAADNAGKAKKAEIDGEAKQLKKDIADGKIQVNLVGTNASGYTNRTKDKRIADINYEYQTAYKNCMNGSDTAGSAARADIDDANQDYQDAKVSYAEALAAINDQKALYTQEVAQAVADGQTNLDAIAAKAQVDLQAASTKYATDLDVANTKITEATDAIIDLNQANTGQLKINNLAAQGASGQLRSSAAGLQVCSGDVAKSATAGATSGNPTAENSSRNKPVK